MECSRRSVSYTHLLEFGFGDMVGVTPGKHLHMQADTGVHGNGFHHVTYQ